MREQEKLVRAVGFWGLIAMCINAVVGSGVFLLPSESFKLLGPFSLWAPLIFSIPVFILVICFAEAASHFKEPGGAYLYSRTAFGDFVGFETGWMNTLARVTSLAALSNGVVVSVARFNPDLAHSFSRAAIICGTLIAFAVLHSLGIRYGARTIYFFTFGKMLPLLVFVIAALFVFRINPIPGSFATPGEGTDWSEAALLLLFAYAGFENLAIPAGEFRNPRRDVPLALLFGILAIAIVYVLAQFATMSVLPDLKDTATPIADAAGELLGTTGALLVTVGALLSILGTNLGTMLEGSRMVFALSENRRPFEVLARVHQTFRTPIFSIALLAGVAIPVALSGSFKQLAVLSAVARMTTYLFTCASIPRLRKHSQGLFTAPGGYLFPILGVVVSLTLFLTLKTRHLVAALIALSVGALLWWISSRFEKRHSDLAEPTPPSSAA